MKKSEVRNLKPGTPLVAFNSEDSNGVKCIFVRPEHGGEVALVECAHLGHRASVYRKQIRLAETGAADPHASLRAQYEKDAKWHPRPWELWEWHSESGAIWLKLDKAPEWERSRHYRRKPLIINGIEVPEPVREALKFKQEYYAVNISHPKFAHITMWTNDFDDRSRLSRGLIHLTPEAAAAHGRALASFTEVPK